MEPEYDRRAQNDHFSPEIRHYKSCRICRRQKVRCDGETPCRRCRLSENTCVYDQTSGKRRKPNPPSQPGQKPALSKEQEEIQALKTEVQNLRSRVPGSCSSPNTAVQRTEQAAAADCESLSPDHLEIPVTAVHVMIHPSRHGEAQRDAAGWTPWNQSKWHREEYNAGNIVARGIVEEIEARRLFSNFMQHCNIATPVFDPVLDTFEAVSELYPLTLTVTLALAARQEDHNESKLHLEARKLAADTLFENPCSFDGVQAMLLLAIHSEKTWFAIGHAWQMGHDLHLHASLDRILSSPESCTRYDTQCARLWLFIVYFERAIAIGGARWPRCGRIESAALEAFVEHRYSHPSDIFFCASLELFDMSAGLRFVRELPSVTELSSSLDKCFDRWSRHYDKQCVHTNSFQRTHLKIQTLFTKIWQLAIVGVRGLKTKSSDNTALETIIQIDHELFEYICQSDGYKRYFPWSPTCEVLLLTFTVIVGFKVLSMYPDFQKQVAFKEAAGPIAELLRKHPCERYSTVVDHLLQQSSSQPVQEGRDAEINELDWLNVDWNFVEGQFDGVFGDWSFEIAGNVDQR